MATDIGPKIGIQGEAQFRRELASINTDLKTLGSEMKLVTSEFIGNEKSTEALTAQNQVLENQIYKLTQAQELLEKQLDATSKAYGNDSKEAQALQQKLNNTTIQINKATAQLDANNQQISNNGTLLGKLGINLSTVAQKFGLSTTAANKLTSALGSQAAVYATVGAAVVKLVGALNDLAIKQAAVVDSVNTMATKYHTTSQAIEAFNYAAKFTDVSTETMLGSLSKLTKSMDSAREGTGAAAEAFQRLGVSVTDGSGQLRSSQAVFTDVIDALRNISNETERDAAAMEIFGKSAMELNGVIEAGSAGLKSYMDEAARFGVVLSEAANANLQSLQDTKDQVDSIAEAAKTNAAAAFAPVSEVLQDIRGGFWLTVNELATAIGGFNESGSQMVDINGQIEDSARGATNEIKDQADAIAEATDNAKQYKTAYEQMKGIWDEMAGYGLGKVISSYDPTTGVLREGFVSNQTADMYRSGQYSASDLINLDRQRQQINLDVTLDIDGQKLARVTLDDFESEAQRRGRGATNRGGTSFAER